MWLVVDLKTNLNSYLESLDEETEVRSLEGVINYNLQHADKELPPHHPRQDLFLKAQNQSICTGGTSTICGMLHGTEELSGF